MLKLGLKIGDRVELTRFDRADAIDELVTITLDQTRATGARLVVRDRAGNGVTAWLDVGDAVHLDGYFPGPARIELDKRTKRGAKLVFSVPNCVRIDRVPTTEQPEQQQPDQATGSASLDMRDKYQCVRNESGVSA